MKKLVIALATIAALSAIATPAVAIGWTDIRLFINPWIRNVGS